MAGLCGAVGDVRNTTALSEDLRWTGHERTRAAEDDDVAIATVAHPADADRAYAETNDGDRVWLWGNVWGLDGPDGKEPATTKRGAELCATRYDRHGTEFAERLNGAFAGAIHDRQSGQAILFTDRLGSCPIHYTRTDDGVVFSTSIQSLPLHPGVDTDFHEGYLAEYFALRRPFGIRTPLAGVERTQPGSVTTLDPDGSVEVTRYWKPVHTPLDRPRDYFADRLARTVRTIVAERVDRTTTYGLLLSGGSDSRLVLAALDSLDVPVETFHLTEWHNREANTAARVAEAADAPFTLLQRDRDYQARALERQPELSNFVGYFNQAHAGGFTDTLSSAADVLLTGHYGDMLFKGNHLRRPTVDLGRIGSFDLPFERPVTDVDAFVDHRASVDAPSYLQVPKSVREVYRSDVRMEGEEVVDHGVAYPSLREATLASRCPLTNGTSQFLLHGTAQMMPTWTPFLDNRLLDLFLSTPVRYLLRGDLINAATKRLAPALAEIPHGNNVVPVKYPFSLQRMGKLATDFARRHVQGGPREPHWSHGPWSDHAELIRTHEFVRETLDDHEDRIRELPFLSWEGVNDCYDAHLAGEDRMGPLYALVTFLEMPLVDRVVN